MWCTRVTIPVCRSAPRQVIHEPGSERPKRTAHHNARHISHPDRLLLREQHVEDDVGRGPQIMYSSSAADDARCEEFSIGAGHTPTVLMIAVMGTSA